MEMKKFKIKGKVINGNYKDLKIIDKETSKEVPYVKSAIISMAVGEMSTVTIEYFSNEIELDVEVIEDDEYGE